jgi:HK97 family phage portal protein
MWPFKRQDRALFNVGDGWPPPATAAGVAVNTDIAQRLSAVWACVRLLADVISTMPVDAYRQGSREPIEPRPPILVTPAAGTPMHDWLAQVVRSLLLAGNAWGLVTDRTGAGLRPSRIELLDPARVGVQVDRDGTVTYRLDGAEIDRDELWHLRAYPVAGQVRGLSPIAYAMQNIGLRLAAEQFGAQFFGDNATPSGILTTDQRLTPESAHKLSERWNIYFGSGKPRGRRTAVLGEGARWQAVSVQPEESQFLDTLQFNVAQVCRIYGVPPEMIAAASGDSLTYANVEQRSLDFLTYTVGPWLTRIETALSDLVARGTYVKFNSGALLCTDLKSRYESYEIALRARFLTLDEVRDLEDREPLPESAIPRIEGSAMTITATPMLQPTYLSDVQVRSDGPNPRTHCRAVRSRGQHPGVRPPLHRNLCPRRVHRRRPILGAAHRHPPAQRPDAAHRRHRRTRRRAGTASRRLACQ